MLESVEDEILALVDEDDQALTAKEQRQIAIKDLKRQQASKVAEDRLKKLRKDYSVGRDDELSSSTMGLW